MRVATPEKAWLDTCYFAYRGHLFSFDLDTDVDRGMLALDIVREYLRVYDSRFQRHYERVWGRL